MGYADWSKAPEGAVCHTIDGYGRGEWWSKPPHRNGLLNWSGPHGLYDGRISEYCRGKVTDWRNSLERRPADEPEAADNSGNSGDDDIVDADFEDLGDDNKRS